ncbi:hypothetical protein D9M68_158930 [compost metagenome]
MPSKRASLRRHAVAKRSARLRREGFTLTQIADATGAQREQVHTNIQLGERLLSLEKQP